MNEQRLIIFGGSFNPIHYGHLFIAETARQTIAAQRVLFVPTRRPHHRPPLCASVEDRLVMLRGAIASNPAFAIDESDIREAASGYTVDLIPVLQQRYPEARLCFLVGEDSLTSSPWHRFDDVVAMLDTLLVARRTQVGQSAGTANLDAFLHAQAAGTRGRIVVLEQPRVTISATAIRQNVAAGDSIRYLVPDVVRNQILTKRLYCDESAQ